MDGWRDRSSFDDLVQSERAPARFTNLQKFSSDSNALAFQGPRYDLHIFLFFLFELRIGRTACSGILSKLRMVHSGSFVSMSSPVGD